MRLTQEEEELLRRYPPATKEALLEAQDDETEMETGTPLGYIDPMEGKFNVPEGRTYVAPSLAPREAFKNESDYEASRGFEDVSPAYWKRGGGDLASEERAQRAKIADYEAQKYGDIANKSDLIKEAIEEKRRGELVANVGQGLSTMFRANADALGRGRDDSGYWNALRQQAASGVTDAMEAKKAAITDYLTKKRLGSEAISEFEKSRSADYDYERKDPNSDISIAAQRFFLKTFPEKYATEDVQNMSAQDILDTSKIISSAIYAELNAKLKEAQIGIEKDKAATADKLAQAKLQGKPPKEMSQEEKALFGAKTDYYKALGLKAGREGTKTVVDPKTGKETTVPELKEEKLTVDQRKMATFWDRADRSNIQMDKIVSSGYIPKGMPTQIAIDNYITAVKPLQKQIAKKFLNEQDIMFANQKAEFINAILRNDSGASIPESEYVKYSYLFPESGDTPQIIEQKRKQRADTLSSLKAGIGEGYSEKIIEGRTKEEPKTTVPMVTPDMAGSRVINGVLYKKVPGGWEKVK